MIEKNETDAGGTLPQITFRDFKIIANDKRRAACVFGGFRSL